MWLVVFVFWHDRRLSEIYSNRRPEDCTFFSGRILSKTKTYFLAEQKTDTSAQLEKSSSSPHAASVFVPLSIIPSVSKG
jgi:hypothetical protein